MAATISTGVKALNKIQMGPESTAGTAVAATTIWRGMGSREYDYDIVQVMEEVGIAMRTNRFYNPRLGAKFNLDPVEATFQQLPYIFEGGVSIETPTQDGAGSDYIYNYKMPYTAMNSIRTYTFEGGDNVEAEEMEYGFCESFKISGNAAEGVMMESVWRGRQLTDATFTAALSVPTLVPGDHIVFGGSTFYIDAVGGTIGSTAISNTLLSFELDVTTGLKAKYTNAAKYFDFIYFDAGSFDATLKLVYEHNAASEGQKDLYKAVTPRLFRLYFPGPAVGTPGTTYSTKAFFIDAAGTYTSNVYGDIDGNNTIEMEVKPSYDLTAALGLEFTVVNELSALP